MNKTELYIFHTGKVKVDRAIPLRERNPLAVTGLLRSRKKQMMLPVSAYLIVHPKGNILIDTGWNTKYAFERPKQLFGMVDKISAPIISADEGIDSKLRAVGLTPENIDHVIYKPHGLRPRKRSAACEKRKGYPHVAGRVEGMQPPRSALC